MPPSTRATPAARSSTRPGELVGINTLIQSPSAQSVRHSLPASASRFPVDFARDIAEQLIDSGEATHPYMGVSSETVDRSIAQQFGLPVDSGVLVQFVQPESPAETAGIERGDIIVSIGGRDVGSVEDVFAAVRGFKIGDRVDIELVRNDTRRTVALVLGSDADRR